MTSKSIKSVEEIFSEALGRIDPAERQSYVKAACGDDPRRLEEVNELIAAHEEAGDFLREEDAPTSLVSADKSSGAPAAHFARAFFQQHISDLEEFLQR